MAGIDEDWLLFFPLTHYISSLTYIWRGVMIFCSDVNV